MASITLNKPSGGSATISAPDDGLTSVHTLPTAGFGKMLQHVTGANGTQYSSSSAGIWVTTFSFSIDNVKENSRIIIDITPAGLIEGAGAVLYAVFDSDGIEMGRTVQQTTGTTGWHTPATAIKVEDQTPVVGTNTYTMRMYTTGPAMYLNYNYYFAAYTWWTITEVAA